MSRTHTAFTALHPGLPELAYVLIDLPLGVGIVKRGQSGYHPYVDWSRGTGSEADRVVVAQAQVNSLNAALGVTRQQSEAMKAGSLAGWHIPAASPEAYDENGRFKRRTHR